MQGSALYRHPVHQGGLAGKAQGEAPEGSEHGDASCQAICEATGQSQPQTKPVSPFWMLLGQGL